MCICVYIYSVYAFYNQVKVYHKLQVRAAFERNKTIEEI